MPLSEFFGVRTASQQSLTHMVVFYPIAFLCPNMTPKSNCTWPLLWGFFFLKKNLSKIFPSANYFFSSSKFFSQKPDWLEMSRQDKLARQSPPPAPTPPDREDSEKSCSTYFFQLSFHWKIGTPVGRRACRRKSTL